MDVPGHIGRYRVQLDLQSSEHLQRYFEFYWALIGNLGVDLLVIPLSAVVGLENAVKLIVLAIPPLTVLGLFWVAYEIHGGIPPTAAFAIPFIFGFPFNYGFINFSLSMALALVAFGLWLHLGRLGRTRLRATVFLGIAPLVWVTHVYGWAFLGLLVLASELVSNIDARIRLRDAARRTILNVIPLAWPLVLMLLWRNDAAGGDTQQFFHIAEKLYSLFATLRDRWWLWDCFSLAAVLLFLGAATFEKWLGFSRKLLIVTAVLGACFLVLPQMVFGSAYADMRLAPYMLMIAVLAVRIRSEDRALASRLAGLAVAFAVVRILGTTASYAIADAEMNERLQALDHIDRGAAVLTLAGNDCLRSWAMPRHWHAGGFVTARKHGFANNQWQASGAQLLRVNYPQAGRFRNDRSVQIFSSECIRRTARKYPAAYAHSRTAEQALREFPRDAFQYVWVLKAPEEYSDDFPDLALMWQGQDSRLYEVGTATGPALSGTQ